MSDTVDQPVIKDLEKFKSLINTAQKFLVLSHENPDPDAYGSAGGIGQSLKLAGKQVSWANVTGTSEDLSFIAGVKETTSEISTDFKPDAVLIVDCGDRYRIGEAFKAQVDQYQVPVVNIDHHISNDSFGSINIVDTSSSSTAEIIVALILAAELPFDGSVAAALYSGIVADSGSFRYSCVRPYTFVAALECVKHGANPAQIAQLLFGRSTLSRIKLHSLALQKMTMHCNDKLAFIVATEDDYAACSADSDDSDGLAEKARDIKGVVVSILFKHDRRLENGENKLIWKISMRSKSSEVDLSALAQQFGGGGHKAAAAFRYRKELQDLQKQLIEVLDPVLKNISM